MKKLTFFIFLIIGMSAYGQIKQREGSSSGDRMRRAAESLTHERPAEENRDPVMLENEVYAYGWITQSHFFPTGSVRLSFQDGQVTFLAEVDANVIKMAGGDFANGTWYAVSHHPLNSGLYTIDTITGAYSLVGATGKQLTGLAWHEPDRMMYASGLENGNSYLYTVDLSTGLAAMVGEICSGNIVGIAADVLGQLYGINYDDLNLYSIDANTGAGSIIGNFGKELTLSQDIGFDRDNNVLYGHLYGPAWHNPNHSEGALYEICTQTGQATATWYNQFEMACFGIPYTAPAEGVPAAVASAAITADAQGALQVLLSWTNPADTYSGEPLNDFSSVVIEREGQVIHTITSPVAGAQGSFTDNLPGEGVYTYLVYAVNSEGVSPKRLLSTYVGHDLPSAPLNVSLAAVADHGHVSWQQPASGLHGGYFSTASLTYTVTRYPDEVVLAENITETEYLDTSVPGMGVYHYRVTACNHIGQGGSSLSGYELLQKQEGVLFFTDFSYDTDQAPPGWTLTDQPADNWVVAFGDGAGGEIPELWFNWLPDFSGLSRIMSPQIDLQDNRDLRLMFKQGLYNYGSDDGEIIGVDYTYDGGDSWITLWESPVGIVDFEAEETELYFRVSQEAEAINLAFRFEGLSANINQWRIDDVMLTIALNNDLMAGVLDGNMVIASMQENIFTLEVINGGSNTQADYTVKLMKEGGTVLATAAGTEIGFSEKKYFDLTWAPGIQDYGIDSVYGLVEFAADENQENNQGNPFKVIIAPEGTMGIEIGSEQYLSGVTPMDFNNKHSLAQTIYYPEELILSMGSITGIIYSYSFAQEVNNVPVKIWLGETTLEDLSSQWTPASDLQLMFDGLIDLPAGMDHIYIPFEDGYHYNGGNLLVFTNKTYDQEVYNNVFFNSWDSMRERSRFYSSADPLDPYQVPDYQGNTNDYPNIRVLFSAAGMGGIQGMVTSQGEAVQGVKVLIAGTNATTHTDQDGVFGFPWVNSGNHSLEFSKHGYYDYSIYVDVEEGITSSLEVGIDKIATILVSGKLTGNDAPGQGITNATITLKGYQDYVSVSDNLGNFSFDGVYVDRSYELDIMVIGYNRYSHTLDVGNQDLDLGTVELSRLAPGVGEVIATATPQGALISWQQPGQPQIMLWQHDGVPDEFVFNYQWGFRVYGTVFDLEEFPDAKISFIDFFHLSWDMPEDNYPYLVHIVDWDNFQILTTLGPLYTQVTDDWEQQVDMGEFDVSGYNRVGIMIQPEGNDVANAYPNIATDAQGMNGMSLNALAYDLQDYSVNEDYMGDFLINLWITTSYGKNEVVRAPGFKPQQQANQRQVKDLSNYRVYRMEEGQEEDMDIWWQVSANVSDTFLLDTGWITLPEGNWRYAVMAEYPNQILSEPRLSNTLTRPLSVGESVLPFIKVFPNPATRHFSIQSPVQMLGISMADLTGRVIYSKEIRSDEHEINVLGLKPGFYLMQIRTINEVRIIRVQVM